MRFDPHLDLLDKHSFLSPSNYHWINYDEDKLASRYDTWQNAARGSELHALAHNLIRLKVKLDDSPKTLNMYVNDAIGYRMRTEQPLFYSYNCFGTADAINFKSNLLRIHDLKTGFGRVSMNQLKVYAAIFFLEYGMRLNEVDIELRIYQNDEVAREIPEKDEIYHIMDKIVTFDRQLDQFGLEDDRG